MAVAFHRLDQYREENAQPLAADSIGRLPQYRQRLMHRLVVNSLPLAGGWCGRRMIQHAQRVLAVIPGYPDELGQDLSPLATIAAPLISLPHRILKFSPCRHTQLPRHLLHHPAAPSPRGSSLREATTGDPVTKIVSQCDRQK
jgi:hypothetical protein